MGDCKTLYALKSYWTACVKRSNNNNSDNNNNVIIQSTQLYQEGNIGPFPFSCYETFSLHLFQEADQEQDRKVKDCCMHLEF